MNFRLESETLAYHAARVLLLIALCGKPRGRQAKILPGIAGRTLLAKLDFFLRYPAYLKRAAAILGKHFTDEDLDLVPDSETRSVESRMVRYRYGPWDHLYYLTLAYLIGKELIYIELERGNEIFRLTEKGHTVAVTLANDPAYSDFARRAESAYKLFNTFSGTRLKEFIYQHFPEVVNRELGATI